MTINSGKTVPRKRGGNGANMNKFIEEIEETVKQMDNLGSVCAAK